MSRSNGSYDADWQRRKSVLNRSLFHDIPILSPVEEESSDSNYVPTQKVFASPPRPYSPLPPLIIEKVPITNKHDEPEEYYSKLEKKIKSIYKQLFIEKRNFSSIDYDTNYSDSSVNDDSENNSGDSVKNFLESHSTDNGNFDSINEDKKTTQSSASTKSNGYGADVDSMHTTMIDVVNYTASTEDGIMISEEGEPGNENIYGDGIRNEDSDNSRSSENPEFSRGKKSHHSIINDHKVTESQGSNEREDEQSYEKEGSDDENIDGHEIIEEVGQTGESHTVRIDDSVFSGREESDHSLIDDHEKTESEESNETEDEQQLSNETKSKQELHGKELKSKEFENTAFEDGNELIDSNVEPMEEDVETSDFSEGPVYRQITTAAMVHFNESQDADDAKSDESQVYEDSVKSVILPARFRRVVVSRNVDVDDRIEVLPIFENNADSKIETSEEDFEEMATPQPDAKEEGSIEMRTSQADALEEDDEEISNPQPESAEEDVEGLESPQPAARDKETEEVGIPLPERTEENVEEMGIAHPIEQMRTPRPDVSHGSVPITHRSHSASTSEHTGVPQEPTPLTSSTQDGADHSMLEIQTSNDLNEILTSIFNENRIKDGTPISGRKRTFVDKSVQAVQTSKVTWEEMRANFSVGTSKIFRLCGCKDHIC